MKKINDDEKILVKYFDEKDAHETTPVALKRKWREEDPGWVTTFFETLFNKGRASSRFAEYRIPGHMYEYCDDVEKMDPPKGTRPLLRLFIRDEGQKETTFEIYIFMCIDDHIELPNGYKASFGEIIFAQSHIETNFGQVDWGIYHVERGNVFRWIQRVMIDQSYKYEIYVP